MGPVRNPGSARADLDRQLCDHPADTGDGNRLIDRTLDHCRISDLAAQRDDAVARRHRDVFVAQLRHFRQTLSDPVTQIVVVRIAGIAVGLLAADPLRVGLFVIDDDDAAGR